jgi:hypothetical protein
MCPTPKGRNVRKEDDGKEGWGRKEGRHEGEGIKERKE